MREHLAYSKQVEFPAKENEDENNFPESTLRIRFALAGILFLLVIIFDLSGKKLAGISTEQFFRAVSTDYGTTVETWLETFSLQTQEIPVK